MKIKLAIILVFMFATAGCSTVGVKSEYRQDNAVETALLYSEFIDGPSPNIAQLTLFFSKMPKGADLHHHYSGSIYAETYLDWFDDERFMMRYQTYATRNSSPSMVFSALYSAFKAADACDLLVGVNIVGPENGVTAIADYRLHMRMFAYLREKFPGVNRALHAGELALGMVRPKDLKFHIAEAVRTAGAQRIGHGVDLPYEDDAVELLKQMKEKTAVEICLTRNEFILGVEGDRHPYLIYSANDIPIVICTDDSGVSRNNLAGEYVLLASRYKPDYETVKKYVYNSIKHSFLSEGDKRKLAAFLDADFSKFEAEMAEYREMVRR